MRKLTDEEFNVAPNTVKYIYTLVTLKKPVSASLFNDAITEYPSYFPEEAEARKKYNSIPQHVHEAYWMEYWKLHNKICNAIPHYGLGILFYSDNPEQFVEYQKAMAIAEPKLERLKKKLHKKYYEKYGIDYK